MVRRRRVPPLSPERSPSPIAPFPRPRTRRYGDFAPADLLDPRARSAVKPDADDAASERVADAAPRLLLHASSLTFLHPVSGAPMTFESPLPPEFARAVGLSPDDVRLPRF